VSLQYNDELGKPTVAIPQKNRFFLKRIQELYGGKIYRGAGCYQLIISRAALNVIFLGTIVSHLELKRDEVYYALEICKRIKPTNTVLLPDRLIRLKLQQLFHEATEKRKSLGWLELLGLPVPQVKEENVEVDT